MTRAMADPSQHPTLLPLAAEIVAAYAGSHSVAVSDLPALIASVCNALRQAGDVADEKPTQALMPAVPIKRSITPDYLICLEDGKKLKMLKRHLKTRYDLTPEDYRKRWGLPADYPMAAPNYAAQRSALARRIGLGTRKPAAPPTPTAEPTPVAKAPRRRAAGRQRAA